MYNIGDEVWWARCDNRNVTKTCPICFGKRQVTLILGNNDILTLPCNYCGIGFGEPSGHIDEWEYISQPELIAISEVHVNKTQDGDKVEYRYGSWCPYTADLFNTREEAMFRCEEKIIKLKKEQQTRAEHIKGDKNKSYSWNAGYHQREAKRHEENAIYHREHAKLCKSKNKAKRKKSITTMRGIIP